MLLLAIDTSTTAIGVALHDGAGVVAHEATLDARAHAEHLAPGIERALRSAQARPEDVTDVVVGIGPGPFTGLRVGIVTGRTFAFALGLPVRGLCSLDALAHAAWLAGHRGDLLVATDARRKEVYAAQYLLHDTGATRVAGPVVDRATDLPDAWRVMPVAGRGPLLYPDAFSGVPVRAPRFGGIPDSPGTAPTSDGLRDVPAGALADLAARRIAAGGPFDGLEPLYLRRPDVAPAAPVKSTLG
ncbi:tRNA (adenosine(37)-N6)-threonylcarbamoyltransferase complex dimerization subunit type 1 TsaB [Intrasporangium sp.]|uniref:tRNA (adenosine(37)-N6)-threonylcarbamoyltransferase complex dimerization subunit type 1 TsaB n=1 Tax=Intrasporangium sp. TaxID=1925024 RepID=UPI003221F4EE